MLDAARDLLLEEGSRSATMDAIASASGAPTGSLYHRFGSRDELIAGLWIRAVQRSQASFLAAVERDSPREAALAAALSIVDFCEDHPADAQLLVGFRREDLIRAVPDGPLADELAVLNRPVERAVMTLARRLYGRRSRAALDRRCSRSSTSPTARPGVTSSPAAACPRGCARSWAARWPR